MEYDTKSCPPAKILSVFQIAAQTQKLLPRMDKSYRLLNILLIHSMPQRHLSYF